MFGRNSWVKYTLNMSMQPRVYMTMTKCPLNRGQEDMLELPLSGRSQYLQKCTQMVQTLLVVQLNNNITIVNNDIPCKWAYCGDEYQDEIYKINELCLATLILP